MHWHRDGATGLLHLGRRGLCAWLNSWLRITLSGKRRLKVRVEEEMEVSMAPGRQTEL